MALNKYLARTHELIDQYKGEAPFTQFQNLDGNLATFDDLVWFHIDPNTGTKTRLSTGIHGIRGGGSAGSDSKHALREPYGDLVKVFAIEVFNSSLSAGEKYNRIGAARRLLTTMKGELHTQTAPTIIECNKGTNSISRVIVFLEFCEQHGLMPRVSEQVRRANRSLSDRDSTGHKAEATQREKMAKEEVIKAVGNVYGKTVTSLLNGNAEQGYFRDALTSFIVLLCLASPNRASAEVSLLANQKLQSYSEDGRPEVFFLDWHGSKGYQDNKNHILSALSLHVEKGLNYFSKACQPGRIIAAYYINPNQALGELLGDFPLDPERKARLDLSRKPHLFTLGYALGFYAIDESIEVFNSDAPVRRRSADPSKPIRHGLRYNCWQPKYIYELQTEDKISTSTVPTAARQSIVRLSGTTFGNTTNTSYLDHNGNGLVSIERVESFLIELHKKAFPSFPEGFSTGDLNSVRMDTALFCVLGHQFFASNAKGKKGGRLGSRGYYSIVSPKSLAQLAAYDLGNQGNYFTRHGFKSRYFLNFHQLRHYTNTVAERSGIPNEVVTAWSGRKSREQTHEYVHTSHADRSARVSDVQTKTNDTTQPIRWVSRNEIEQEFNLPASVTSTGICAQNLIVSPCEYLNDFVSSCFMCPNACHVAGDTDAIATLEKDCQFQQKRLEAVRADARLAVSKAMQDWFILHNRNTQVLAQLVQLMKEQPKGTVISFNDKGQQFNLVDTKTKAITHVVAKLTDSRSDLEKALDQQNKGEPERQPNDDLTQLMAKYSLVETA